MTARLLRIFGTQCPCPDSQSDFSLFLRRFESEFVYVEQGGEIAAIFDWKHHPNSAIQMGSVAPDGSAPGSRPQANSTGQTTVTDDQSCIGNYVPTPWL